MPIPGTHVVHPDRKPTVAAVLDDTKPSLATILRRRFDKSPSGGETETIATIATGVPCRIRNATKTRAQTGLVADQPTERSLWLLTFPSGTDVTQFDQVVVDGRTFDVREVGDESYEPEQAALCAEVIV